MMTSGSDMEGYPADLNEMDSMEGSGDTMALVFDEEEVAVLKQEAISPEQSLGKENYHIGNKCTFVIWY